MSPDVTANVCVVGLGYIGLPTAAVIARSGAQVLGVDVRPAVVDTINAGKIHIEEANLDLLVHAMVESGSLRAALTPEPSDVFIVAVPTPFTDDHAPDIGYVLAATRSIAPALRTGSLVIVESTCPVGTTEAVRDVLRDARPDLSFPDGDGHSSDVCVAYCPERVLPGKILDELVSNDRSIGGLSRRCAERAVAFYRTFVAGDCIATTARTAEMCKLVENSFRDVNIAFANELSIVCDTLKLDVWEVIRLANRHPRVNILQPGPGVGGHCIAVDPWFIVDSDPENARLIRIAREVNDGKAHYSFARAAALAGAHPDAAIACLGLAFKANIDDLRESPALGIAVELAKAYGNRVRIVEPHVTELPAAFDGTGATLAKLDQALDECGVLIVLVDHDAFKNVSVNARSGKAIYDTRGIWRG
ncbi:UDP-N-acetyl-D-mannosamine dehydrogenase [Sphingomonas sp.]|jgi:UDP-N-acetyl-D-mannosaminuronic acid dehydrogenase|uniref:UDP-N-acetyl-D-mannosamine dehydrogenase n=1 Tax=Sphingomonas sp. TaxID=28214 RepID=UPI002E33177A|nr:UDP-N-acetyl-D-mannosamine dehydrogenase [Sphingomonas sp.]HEX4695926.1 UDP-N-acetyl-D-mannosamine dehydrogenase [Sphingomonas sp.]